MELDHLGGCGTHAGRRRGVVRGHTGPSCQLAGGEHPLMGTHNRVFSIACRCVPARVPRNHRHRPTRTLTGPNRAGSIWTIPGSNFNSPVGPSLIHWVARCTDVATSVQRDECCGRRPWRGAACRAAHARGRVAMADHRAGRRPAAVGRGTAHADPVGRCAPHRSTLPPSGVVLKAASGAGPATRLGGSCCRRSVSVVARRRTNLGCAWCCQQLVATSPWTHHPRRSPPCTAVTTLQAALHTVRATMPATPQQRWPLLDQRAGRQACGSSTRTTRPWARSSCAAGWSTLMRCAGASRTVRA